MYEIFLGSQPEKFLKKTEKEQRARIWKKLKDLKQNPFPSEVVRVVGKREKSFRVRVGQYRIQYHILKNEKEIIVFDIDKRGRAYK